VAALFGLGALVGTVGDRFHLHAGVLSYPDVGVLWGQPLWVPLLFGAAGLVLPSANAALLVLAHEREQRGSARRLAAEVLWFLSAYASTALFRRAPALLTIALVVAWGIRVALAPTLDRLLAGPIFALAGPMFEAALSWTGAFRYRHPDLLLVPAWLPALYLHASLMTREAALVFLVRARRGTSTSPSRPNGSSG
jgi:hypothetical protein